MTLIVRFVTHEFGRAEVEEEVLCGERLHVQDDGVVAAFLDVRLVGADTVSPGRHGHFNLEVKGQEVVKLHIMLKIFVYTATQNLTHVLNF